MEYIEWKNCKKNLDSGSELCPGYYLDEESKFIMEPAFYTQLKNLEPLYPDKFNLVIETINKVVKEKKKVFFTLDYESPFIELEGYIYLEIEDILDSLKIFVEDKSRGSDYGD